MFLNYYSFLWACKVLHVHSSDFSVWWWCDFSSTCLFIKAKWTWEACVVLMRCEVKRLLSCVSLEHSLNPEDVGCTVGTEQGRKQEKCVPKSPGVQTAFQPGWFYIFSTMCASGWSTWTRLWKYATCREIQSWKINKVSAFICFNYLMFCYSVSTLMSRQNVYANCCANI